MEKKELYDLIGLPPEIIGRLQAAGDEVDLGQAEPYLERMTDRQTAAEAYRDLVSLLAEDTDNLKMLYCQLECARRVFERYRQKGIEGTVYVDTMKCFTRFLKECGKKNGRMFFDRGWWTYRQVSMALFRIGALEYEFATQEGENTVAVHIPSDADLSPEAVDRSFKEAGTFFRDCFSEYRYGRYTCDSWLLSPVLKQLLPDRSNIVSFQERFTVTSVDREDREFIEWLFQVPKETAYDRLPARTTLQRNVRTLLLEGGTVGAAFGSIKM